ncbi:MAG: hypothetical protein ABSF23_09470 [Terracidiphilus sp.]|jgi:hypothetical protein
MKFVLCSCAALAMAFGAMNARATDITGTWTAEMTSPDGSTMQMTFTFKQDGAKLTGTAQGPMGDPTEISNGKIDGDKFSFDVSFNGMTISHQCTVDGDTIKMSAKSEGGEFPPMELTLKRVKEAAPAAPTAPAAPAAPAQPAAPPATPAQPSQPPK